MPTIKLNSNSSVQKYGPDASRSPIPRDNTGDALLRGSRIFDTKIRMVENERRDDVAQINNKLKERVNGINNALRSITNGVGIWERASERRARLEVDQFKSQFHDYMNRETLGYFDDKGNKVAGTYDEQYTFVGDTSDQHSTGPYTATAKKIADFKTSDTYNALSSRAKRMIDEEWNDLGSRYLNKANRLQMAQYEERKKAIAEQKVASELSLVESNKNISDVLSGDFDKNVESIVGENVTDEYINKNFASQNEDGTLSFHAVDMGDGVIYSKEDVEKSYYKMLDVGLQNHRVSAFDKMMDEYINTNNDSDAEDNLLIIQNIYENGDWLSEENKKKVQKKYSEMEASRRARINKHNEAIVADCDLIANTAILNDEEMSDVFIKSIAEKLNKDGTMPTGLVEAKIDEYQEKFYMRDFVKMNKMLASGNPEKINQAHKMMAENTKLREMYEHQQAEMQKKQESLQKPIKIDKPKKITSKTFATDFVNNGGTCSQALDEINKAYKEGRIEGSVYQKNFDAIKRVSRLQAIRGKDWAKVNTEIREALAFVMGSEFDPQKYIEWDDSLDRPRFDSNGNVIPIEGKTKNITRSFSLQNASLNEAGSEVEAFLSGQMGLETIPEIKITISGDAIDEIWNACYDYIIARDTYGFKGKETPIMKKNDETGKYEQISRFEKATLVEFIKYNLSSQTTELSDQFIQQMLDNASMYIDNSSQYIPPLY